MHSTINSKTRIALAALAMSSAALIPAAAVQAKAKVKTKPTCGPAQALTMVQSGYARVYSANGNVYVCIKGTAVSTQLTGASPTGDVFALGGRYVGWSASTDPTADPTTQLLPHSVVTVMRIPDQHVDSYRYPFETNETVDAIVIAPDGAAAWSMTPPANSDGSYTTVQGTDRQSHPEDQFSDDHADTIGTSLAIHGKTVTWRYVDGTTGSQSLF